MPGKYPYLVGKLDFTALPAQPPQPLAVNSALGLALLSPGTGIVHFARTGSASSLVAGLSLGVLYLVSYRRQKEQQTFAEETGLLASAFWAASTVPKALKSGWKPLPLGWSVMAMYGVGVFGTSVNKKRLAAARKLPDDPVEW